MNTLEPGTRLVVASHNKGKVWEIHQLIAPYGLNAISAGELGLDEPEETELTFAGNARLKALAAATSSGLPALADDSGLEVDCLGGAPGIYSARWAGPGKDFGIAMKKVADEIATRKAWTAPGPRANFTSALCLAFPDATADVFEGKVFGHLVWPPRGGNGFGYDPMFIADGETQTFGEMEPKQKYAISHRTRAFAEFKAACLDPIFGGALSVQPKAPGSDLDAIAAAAASLSTRAEFVEFVRRLTADVSTYHAGLELPRVLSQLEAALREKPDSAVPPWRDLAMALARAVTRGAKA